MNISSKNIPLIEPDVRIARIRLSDKTSRLHPRHVVPKPAQAYEPEVPVKVRKWISPAPASPGFLELLTLVGATESEIAAAFATIVEQRAGALLISSGAYSPAATDQVLSLARRYAVPTLFFTRNRVVSGGLASYGTPASEVFRQVGIYTGRILKGEKPADLPVVQPTKIEFVINLKTAKALGLTIPETLLATADEIIQ